MRTTETEKIIRKIDPQILEGMQIKSIKTVKENRYEVDTYLITMSRLAFRITTNLISGKTSVYQISIEKKYVMECNQCEAAMINGVFCHETGCPNTHARFDADTGEWIKQRVCYNCGNTIDADGVCCLDED